MHLSEVKWQYEKINNRKNKLPAQIEDEGAKNDYIFKLMLVSADMMLLVNNVICLL